MATPGEEKKHALLSPSSADRWLRCYGSVAANAEYPDTSSAAAEEGTKAHALAAEILTRKEDADNTILGDVYRDILPYLEAVRERTTPQSIVLIEQELGLEPITGEKDAVGTADAVIITPRDDGGATISILDLKFGRGVEVEAVGNNQLMVYLLAALEQFAFLGDFDEYELVICQPRIDPDPKVWFPQRDSVETMRVAIQDAARTILISPVVDRNPGEIQCKWCRAKADCPELGDFVKRQTGLTFDPETLAEKRAAVSLIEDWCAAVKAEVQHALERGDGVDGWKLVQGRDGNRAWLHSTYAEMEGEFKKARLRKADYTKPSLYSPTEMEKVIGPKGTAPDALAWARLQKLVVRAPGKPTAVPESDKRPRISVDSQDFKNLEDTNA